MVTGILLTFRYSQLYHSVYFMYCWFCKLYNISCQMTKIKAFNKIVKHTHQGLKRAKDLVKT